METPLPDCPHPLCDAPVPPESKFCPRCGRSVSIPPASPADADESYNNVIATTVVIVVLLFMVGLAAAFTGLFSQSMSCNTQPVDYNDLLSP